MVNYWLEHVAQTRKKNPQLSLNEAMRVAKYTYMKSKNMNGAGASAFDALSQQQKLEVLDKNVERGLDFTKFVLQDPTRVRRVEMRQDSRDLRREGNIKRQNEIKNAQAERAVAVTAQKTKAIERKEQLKDAKFQKRLDRYK